MITTAPKAPIARAHATASAIARPGRGQRQRHPPEHPQRPVAQQRRLLLEAGVDAANAACAPST